MAKKELTAWDKLSMSEKALFMKLGLLHGLSDLKDIRDTYNLYSSGGDLVHKKSGEELEETEYLKLDDAANYKAYEDATNYFLNLGFGSELASKYAIDRVHNNMTFDAGLLPEVTVTALAWGNGDNTSRMLNYLNALKSKRETILNIEQAAFNLNIRNATDKWGKGIGLGMTALAALPVASGAMAGMNALRASYPIATGLWDAYWAGDGIVRNLFGDSGVRKTYNLAKQGDVWGTLKSGAGDALDLLGVADLFSLGKKILTPSYRAAHAYHTIEPFGYHDPINRGKKFITSLLTGNTPNTRNNAPWLDRMLQSDYVEDFKNFYGRDEAFRLYLGLPTRRGYYTLNPDGTTYSYNLNNILKDYRDATGEFNMPLEGALFADDMMGFLKSSGHKGRDYITTAGGNLSRNDLIKNIDVNNTPISLLVRQMEDTWDLLPFKKLGSLTTAVDDYTKQFAEQIYAPMYNTLSKISDTLFKTHSASYSPLLIWYNYLGGKQLNNLRVGGLPTWMLHSLENINSIKNMEMGPILGGNPFTMVTNVPMTKIPSPKGVQHTLYLLGFPENVNVNGWNIPHNNYKINQKSTGGPLYPFSFEKNPFLKTPIVRY